MSAEHEKREMANGCSMYDPCPICFNCMNKAAHLYARCITCPVPHDGHTHRHRSFLIRRENFAITVTKETGEKIKALVEQKHKEWEAKESEKESE